MTHRSSRSLYDLQSNRWAQRLLVELEDRARREHVPPTVLAIAHIGLGQDGRAFDRLDRAVAERDGWIAEHIFHPTFDSLRSHPRYAMLLQSLGLRQATGFLGRDLGLVSGLGNGDGHGHAP